MTRSSNNYKVNVKLTIPDGRQIHYFSQWKSALRYKLMIKNMLQRGYKSRALFLCALYQLWITWFTYQNQFLFFLFWEKILFTFLYFFSGRFSGHNAKFKSKFTQSFSEHLHKMVFYTTMNLFFDRAPCCGPKIKFLLQKLISLVLRHL